MNSYDEIDAFTRCCSECGQLFQAEKHDDPLKGGPIWEQAIGPCCHSYQEQSLAYCPECEATFSEKHRPTFGPLCPRCHDAQYGPFDETPLAIVGNHVVNPPLWVRDAA